MEKGREAGWEAKKKKEKAKRGTEEIPNIFYNCFYFIYFPITIFIK